jgi:medium-chain acyl-[acyl-carrier-protein] hydrolase
MDKTYTANYFVHTYEVDFRARALPLTLLNYLQDAAGEHATRLGFSVLELLKRNLTWLLSRYHIRVRRYPSFGETVAVTTWPSGKQGIFALRDFEIADADGRIIGEATSSWVLWNLKLRQPARLEENLPDRAALDKRAVADDFGPLPACPVGGRELPFRVEMQDIDFNNHVNHPIYIQWALEAAPESVLRTLVPVEIEVAYKGEALYGEEVISRIHPAEEGPRPVFLHGICHREKGTELTRIRTAWGPLE